MTLTCDRESLIMFCEGVFFEYDRDKGIDRVQNEADAARAIEALETGEVVSLIVRGRIVSTVTIVEDKGVKRIVELLEPAPGQVWIKPKSMREVEIVEVVGCSIRYLNRSSGRHHWISIRGLRSKYAPPLNLVMGG